MNKDQFHRQAIDLLITEIRDLLKPDPTPAEVQAAKIPPPSRGKTEGRGWQVQNLTERGFDLVVDTYLVKFCYTDKPGAIFTFSHPWGPDPNDVKKFEGGWTYGLLAYEVRRRLYELRARLHGLSGKLRSEAYNGSMIDAVRFQALADEAAELERQQGYAEFLEALIYDVFWHIKIYKRATLKEMIRKAMFEDNEWRKWTEV